MGNRSALILSARMLPEADDTPAFAFEGNNFVPLFWYAAFPAAAVAPGWEARWQAYLEAMEAEAPLPDTTLWTPWPEARERLDTLAARLSAMAQPPPWARLFMTWQASLQALAEAHQAQWLGMGLTEIFAFHEEPPTMVWETREGIALWEAVPDLPRAQHPRELTGDPADPLTASHLRDEAGAAPPARTQPHESRRPMTARDWLLIPCLGLLVAGAWIYTGSILATLAALALVAWGFHLQLKA